MDDGYSFVRFRVENVTAGEETESGRGIDWMVGRSAVFWNMSDGHGVV